jgi:hypothetical protein
MSRFRKSVLSSSPGEGGSCSLETKQIEEGAKTRVVYFEEVITETKVTTPNTVLGSIPVKIVSVALKLSTIEWRKEQNCLFRRGDYRN